MSRILNPRRKDTKPHLHIEQLVLVRVDKVVSEAFRVVGDHVSIARVEHLVNFLEILLAFRTRDRCLDRRSHRLACGNGRSHVDNQRWKLPCKVKPMSKNLIEIRDT